MVRMESPAQGQALGPLQRGQQHEHQQADDRDKQEELDEGKTDLS